eukprot:16441459-Heterocapsa_arctica.AAC.1
MVSRMTHCTQRSAIDALEDWGLERRAEDVARVATNRKYNAPVPPHHPHSGKVQGTQGLQVGHLRWVPPRFGLRDSFLRGQGD